MNEQTLEMVKSDTGAMVRAEDFLPLLTVAQAVERKHMLNEFVAQVLKEGEDYGKIPGGQQKPVLMKPGAEKLCSIFGLAPRYLIESETEDWLGEAHGGEPFFNYRYRCQLTRGDRFMGEAIGSCNSWESKYRYRNTARKCPECQGEFIIQGKLEYGGGWLCFKKKGGCGAKFEQGDEAITSQVQGKTANPDVADQVNTLQKMAQKRALVAAVLVVTNCSDAFTQDLEDTSTEGIDTGGHPVGTKAAQEHVRDEKIKNGGKPPVTKGPVADKPADPPTQVPPDLKLLFENIDEGKPGYVTNGFNLMRRKLTDAMPNGAGEKAYLSILEDHGIKKGDKPEISKVKAAIVEMYHTCEAATAAAESPDAYHATDEDVPLFAEQPEAKIAQ